MFYRLRGGGTALAVSFMVIGMEKQQDRRHSGPWSNSCSRVESPVYPDTTVYSELLWENKRESCHVGVIVFGNFCYSSFNLHLTDREIGNESEMQP